MAPTFEVLHSAAGPSAALRVTMPALNDSVHCESDAAVCWRGNIQLEGKAQGGLLASLFRSVVGGESFFVQTWRATGPTAGTVNEVILAPEEPGGIVVVTVNHGEDMLLVAGAYLANEPAVNVETDVQFKNVITSVLSQTGLFVLRARGRGKLAIHGHGALKTVELAPGESLAVDNGHVVAWSARTNMRVGAAASSVISSFTSGEGFACFFTGPGFVVYSTHKPPTQVSSSSKAAKANNGPVGNCIAVLVVLLFVVVFVGVFGTIAYLAITGQLENNTSGGGGRSHRSGRIGSRHSHYHEDF